MTTTRILILCSLLVGGLSTADDSYLATEILRELVAYNTAPSGGNDLRPTVGSLVARLRAAGFTDDDIDIVNSAEKLPNLVVRYRSQDAERKPILMMAHLDVVEALPSDWTLPPFTLTEKDGYYYGRGTTDNKAGAAILVANLIRMKRENFQPDRDLIVMLTADEETTGDGATILANEHRHLIDAEFALNSDGGSVLERDGTATAFIMQTSEKVYVNYRLEASDPGGHSSVPRADSAISRLARTLVALQELRFPIDLNDTTRAFFERSATSFSDAEADIIAAVLAGEPDSEVSAALDAFPYINSLLRTTCIATLLSGGHAPNAIPQLATAEVNCRVLPQSKESDVRESLLAIAEPNNVSVTEVWPFIQSPPSPLDPQVVDPVTDVAGEFWPGIVVLPQMSTGATDGLFLRNAGIPVYGVSAIAGDANDSRAHGQDERIRIDAFETATDYWYRLIKNLSQGITKNNQTN
ncbi:MAG: M20/M25/M40 family metallo-hydrolase [Gammaproteobacteria bacterium]|nr:M20/M25/M40 family metallo-hydrolase [Gammaproteobacteria bacterium]